MLVALGPMGFCLLLMPFLPTLWVTALVVLAFFFAYYVYEPPYRGLYPDLLPESVYGRAQSAQHLLRGVALGGALVGGGILLKVWTAAPFVLAAFVTTAACGACVLFVHEEQGGHERVFEGVRAYLNRGWSIVREEPDVRRFLIANAAWEGTFAAARPSSSSTSPTGSASRRRWRGACSAWSPAATSSRRSSPARSATASGSPA